MNIRKHATSEKVRTWNPKGSYSSVNHNIQNHPLHNLLVVSNPTKLQPGLLRAKLIRSKQIEKITDYSQKFMLRPGYISKKDIGKFEGDGVDQSKYSMKFIQSSMNVNPRASIQKIIADSQMWMQNIQDQAYSFPLNNFSSAHRALQNNIIKSSKKTINRVKPRQSTAKHRSKPKSSKQSKKILLKIENFIHYQNTTIQIMQAQKLKGITAEAVSVMLGNKRIYQYHGDQIKQIASVTKIMTCIVCLYLAKKYSINIYEQTVKVSRRAASIQGTSACLKYGDIVTINQLLYGLILPSGNDAATALAQHFHKIMHEKKKNNQDQDLQSPKKIGRKLSQTSHNSANNQNSHLFMKCMNKFAAYLGLKKTNFNNPHGLSDRYNVSTANQVAELTYYCMKNQQFRKIVKAQNYETVIYNSQSKIKRQCRWQNTNKLLGCSDCIGVKTGITPAAGPTMSACFKKDDLEVIAVVLNTKTKPCRFQDTSKLYQWAKKVSS